MDLPAVTPTVMQYHSIRRWEPASQTRRSTATPSKQTLISLPRHYKPPFPSRLPLEGGASSEPSSRLKCSSIARAYWKLCPAEKVSSFKKKKNPNYCQAHGIELAKLISIIFVEA